MVSVRRSARVVWRAAKVQFDLLLEYTLVYVGDR